jgi:hypothetical protein
MPKKALYLGTTIFSNIYRLCLPSASPASPGRPRGDDEIFDFTDSRFVSPPEDSRANFPLSGPPPPPARRPPFAYNPTLLPDGPEYAYSPLLATPTPPPPPYLHLGPLSSPRPSHPAAPLASSLPVPFVDLTGRDPARPQPPLNVVRHLPVPQAQYLPTALRPAPASRHHLTFAGHFRDVVEALSDLGAGGSYSHLGPHFGDRRA